MAAPTRTEGYGGSLTAGQWFTRLAVVAVCGLLGFLVSRAAEAMRSGVQSVPEARLSWLDLEPEGLRIGPHSGARVLRIFADYRCPACAQFERSLGARLRALARRGELTVIYHDAPLHVHRQHPSLAAAVLCARGSAALWQVHRQAYRTALQPVPTLERLLETVAPMVQHPDRLRECATDPATDRRVQAEWRLADQLGIDRVPTVFLDDARLKFRSYRSLLRFIVGHARTSRADPP